MSVISAIGHAIVNWLCKVGGFQMLPDSRKKLKTLLLKHEGLSLYPYTDTTGHISVGVGRNLSTRGISAIEAFVLLDDDMLYFMDTLTDKIACFASLDENRQIVLCDMAFNVGVKGLLEFTDMLAALEKKDYDAAAAAMMLSKWATQVPSRAAEDAEIIRTGIIP